MHLFFSFFKVTLKGNCFQSRSFTCSLCFSIDCKNQIVKHFDWLWSCLRVRVKLQKNIRRFWSNPVSVCLLLLHDKLAEYLFRLFGPIWNSEFSVPGCDRKLTLGWQIWLVTKVDLQLGHLLGSQWSFFPIMRRLRHLPSAGLVLNRAPTLVWLWSNSPNDFYLFFFPLSLVFF